MFVNKSLIAALALCLAPLSALADLAKPAGEVILTVTGQISETNVDGTAQFDLEMLRQLPAEEFTTTTIWTSGPQTFKGVPLNALLQAVGADGKVLRGVAINAYEVTVPATDAVENGPIIAYERNGSLMSIREKGPLWIVYPYDSDPRYRTEIIYSRSIWQLERIDVTE